MNANERHKRVNNLRSHTQRKLNDTYIWCSLATQILERSLKDETLLERGRFVVPSKRIGKTVPRNADKIKAIISGAAEKDLFLAVFVYTVAQVEAFINDIVSTVLHSDKRRLLTVVQGIDPIKSVGVADVLQASDVDELVSEMIQKQVVSVSYGKPADQFKYLEQAIGVTIDEPLRRQWVEIKATRDLIVHNSNVINKTYIDKSGDAARGEDGDEVIVDRSYFELSLASMKTLTGRISTQSMT